MHCGKRFGGKALLSLAIVAFALILAGCGASAKARQAAPPQPSQAEQMKAVVRVWNANVNAGNNAAEARLFSYPALISLMVGPYGCLCRTPAQVVQFHAQLPCTDKIVSIKIRGRYATVVLGHPGDRETSKCDVPPGALTAVRFTIVHGKITAWEQLWWRGASRLCIAARKPDPCRPIRRP